ncbi:AAA family ATPase [Vibrio lentus]|uniref:AAA family ATPase n=1 Tax=Vibrio lentus TaxID=136468 RepID=A0AA45A876_9VIBR|nr:AAA family ATPase [Vibrio lentus]MCB5358391.1 AAA family ATPase [Vibrio lentus]MCB5448859.1 AAA family ATPase [Vibrio lentus]MCB5460746.1 AAA family ATPase [Vibrio lentus]MCC4796003.1 AAA family ATPase [Vibrio lentus]MCC4853373.1 AAA family ATPase [Vibrio lentus]
MQLRKFELKEYRNLRGVDITFAEKYERHSSSKHCDEKAIRSHAVIGQNGTGKSNLMEALITIFRDVDLDRDAGFDFLLEYSIRDHIVKIEADTKKQKRPYVWVDGKSQSQGYLLRNRELLPSHIFAYYSGRNERMEALFQEHQRRFNRRQEIIAEEVIPAELLRNLSDSEADRETIERLRKREENKQLKNFGDDRLRRLFYCRGGHSQLVLLACLLSDDPVFKRVLESLNIESLESALFVLKQPHRLRRLEDDDIEQGDPRFWYARGNVVSEFLDKLWQVSWAPIRHEESKLVDFRGRQERQKQLYMYVPTSEKLRELGELVGTPQSFFRYAEGAYIGDLIDEVRITVKKKDEDGGKVSFTQLSEGELQMLTVLGLMRITSEDHCLFLLDEPDTHLNPIWKLRYFDDIENVLKPRSENAIQGESQILITTHDPMMVGSLKKEQVHIIRKNGLKTLVEQPNEHPQGMGVSGLLKSEMFGLPSTLDRHTLSALDRRNDLLARKKRGELSGDEREELECLVVRLEDLGFSREYRDPMYQLFIEKMYEVRRKPLDQLLNEEELNAQNALAEQIMEQLVKAQRTDELSALARELAEKVKG